MRKSQQKRHLMTGSISRSPIENFEPASARRMETSSVSCMLFMPTSSSGCSGSIASAIWKGRQHRREYCRTTVGPTHLGRQLHGGRHSSTYMQNSVTCLHIALEVSRTALL